MSKLHVVKALAYTAVLGSLSAFAPLGSFAQACRHCEMTEISSSLRAITLEKPGLRRYEMASALAVRLKNLGPKCVTDANLTALIGLLRDDDDSVRFWAAIMIGNIGPSAKRAIPALKGALADRPSENKTMTSAAAIRFALDRLGADAK